MEFIMNGRTYNIKEVAQEEMQREFGPTDGDLFGLTLPSKQEIWLWKELKEDQKRQTLLHELLHCYVTNYITMNACNFDEDIWADISANSHYIINQIANKYFTRFQISAGGEVMGTTN